MIQKLELTNKLNQAHQQLVNFFMDALKMCEEIGDEDLYDFTLNFC